jgi:hypothetical protein
MGGHSHLYQLLRAARARSLAGVAGPAPGEERWSSDRYLDPTPAYLVDGYAISRELVKTMRDRVRADGAELWLALVPVRDQVRPSEWQAVQERHPGATLVRDAPQRAFHGIAQALAVPVVDPLPGFLQREAAGEALPGTTRWRARSGTPCARRGRITRCSRARGAAPCAPRRARSWALPCVGPGRATSAPD